MGVLLLLMTIGGLILATILLIISFLTKKTWLRNLVFICVPLWFVFYAIALIGTSFTSEPRFLVLNESKEFCGFYLDCHLHATVTDIRKTKTIGTQTAHEKGTFVIVKVKVFSDAKNPNIAFRLNEPEVEIWDIEDTIQLNQDIKGNQTIEKEFVFLAFPPDDEFRVFITEGYGIDKIIEAFLIGDEDSIFHQPTVFKINTFSQSASVNN
jgi:hypothetical protein